MKHLMDKQHYSESSLSILVFKLKADKNTVCDTYVFLRRFYAKTCYAQNWAAGLLDRTGRQTFW